MTSLPEEFLLLSLDNEKGEFRSSCYGCLEYGIAGAVLMQLVLSERLRMRDSKVVLGVAMLTGNDVLDDIFAEIRQSKKDRAPEYWVRRLAERPVKKKVLDRLVREGVLRENKRRILWVVPVKSYFERNENLGRGIRNRIRGAVLEGESPEARLAALISLGKTCDLIDPIFAPEERRLARARTEAITMEAIAGEAVSNAVASAQAAIQAAVLGATVAAVHAASTAATTTTPGSSS